MAIPAKFSGRCPKCQTFYAAGTMIEKHGWNWQPVDCAGCRRADQRRTLILRVQDTMIREHGIALGVFGIPDGAKETFTRASWLSEVRRAGAATEEEINEMAQHWLGILDRDLSD